MMYSGIDLHKRTLAIYTLDDAGQVVRKANMPTHREAITAYFATLPGPHQAVVECTGMWYWLRDCWCPQGIDLHLGHAKYLKAISYAKREDRRDRCRDPGAAVARAAHSGGAHDQRYPHREMRDFSFALGCFWVSRSIRCQRSVGGPSWRRTPSPPPRSSPSSRGSRPTSTRRNGSCSRPGVRRLEKELREHVLATPAAQRTRVGARHRANGDAYTLLLEIDGHPPVSHRESNSIRTRRPRPGDRTILAGRPITSDRATAIATSSSRFITPPSGRCSTSRKSAPSSTASTAARGNPSRGR